MQSSFHSTKQCCNCHNLQACKYIPGSELLQMDPTDACEKLRTALKVLGGFKLQYFQYKAASAAECANHPWRFQNSVVFGRLDTFMERCADMLELQSTCMQVCRSDGLLYVCVQCNQSCLDESLLCGPC